MCICAGYTTPLEGVTVYTEPELPEWEALRRFLDGRGVLYQVVAGSDGERLRLAGRADRPVVVIGRSVVVGFDEPALIRLLP